MQSANTFEVYLQERSISGGRNTRMRHALVAGTRHGRRSRKEIFKTMDVVKWCTVFKGGYPTASELKTSNAVSLINKTKLNSVA